MTDLRSPSIQSLVLTVCISQSQANARAIQGLRKQLKWVSVIRAGRGSQLRVRPCPGVWCQDGGRSWEGGGREWALGMASGREPCTGIWP